MAIKGKKKSQARGSQARRRPAAMPRPVTAARKPKWYQTTAGLTFAAIGGILALIVIIWAVGTVRSNAQEAEDLKEALDSYTQSVKTHLQMLTPVATEMVAADASDPEAVAEDAAGWVTTLQETQGALTALLPPVEAQASHDVLVQSVAAYVTAARTFELLGDLPKKEGGELVTTTLAQVSTATGLWDAAVGLLDDARSEAGMRSSGLRSPTSGSEASGAAGSGSQTIELPPELEDVGGNGGGGQGGGEQGGGGNG